MLACKRSPQRKGEFLQSGFGTHMFLIFCLCRSSLFAALWVVSVVRPQWLGPIKSWYSSRKACHSSPSRLQLKTKPSCTYVGSILIVEETSRIGLSLGTSLWQIRDELVDPKNAGISAVLWTCMHTSEPFCSRWESLGFGGVVWVGVRVGAAVENAWHLASNVATTGEKWLSYHRQ